MPKPRSSPRPFETCPETWPPAPPAPTLTAGAVHLWRADLDAAPAAEVARLEGTLSRDERLHASRFAFAPDRRRFTVGRAVLRTILGRYLQMDPALVALARTPQGKPTLVHPPGGTALRFSVSHSAQIALYAVTLGRDVGVDVERLQAVPVAELLASRVLSAREIAELQAFEASARERAFFAVWTRKEAYAKARGLGLPLSFQDFTVSADPAWPALLEAEDDDPGRWTLTDLTVATGFAAALAIEGPLTAPRCWTWEPDAPVRGR